MHLEDGSVVEGKTIIFAMGSNKRQLGVKGEEEFSGKGVTYCATCDAFFYRNKTVAVIGGGDSAVEGAAIAAQVAKKVYLIHRRDTFRAEPYWVDKVKEKENVTMVLNTHVTEILGDQKVTGVKLDVPFEGQNMLLKDLGAALAAATGTEDAPAEGADQTVLVVLNASGQEVARQQIAVSGDPVTWAGTDAAGTPLAAGSYAFRLEHYASGELTGTTAVEAYGRVDEVRAGADGAVLVLQGGANVAPADIRALRSPATG